MSQKFEFQSGNTNIKYSKPSSSDSRTKDEELERLAKERDELAANNARLRVNYKELRDLFVSVRCELHEWDIPEDDHGATEFMKSYAMTVSIPVDGECEQSVAHYKAEGLQMAAEICYDADKSEHSSDLGAKLEALAKEMKG